MYLPKMDSEPGLPNHEAARGRPIQREGIKAAAGVPVKVCVAIRK